MFSSETPTPASSRAVKPRRLDEPHGISPVARVHSRRKMRSDIRTGAASLGTSSVYDRCAHAVDQRGERRAGKHLRIEHRAELRLLAGPARVQHEALDDRIGNLAAQVGRHHLQARDDPGRNTRRGPDAAVIDAQRIHVHPILPLLRRTQPAVERMCTF